MKQHLYAIITMVSLGTIGLVLSQPSFFKSDSDARNHRKQSKFEPSAKAFNEKGVFSNTDDFDELESPYRPNDLEKMVRNQSFSTEPQPMEQSSTDELDIFNSTAPDLSDLTGSEFSLEDPFLKNSDPSPPITEQFPSGNALHDSDQFSFESTVQSDSEFADNSDVPDFEEAERDFMHNALFESFNNEQRFGEQQSDVSFEDLVSPSIFSDSSNFSNPSSSNPGVASTRSTNVTTAAATELTDAAPTDYYEELSSLPSFAQSSQEENDFSVFNQSFLNEPEQGLKQERGNEPQTNLAVVPVVIPINQSGGGSTGNRPAIGSSYAGRALAPAGNSTPGFPGSRFNELDNAFDPVPMDFSPLDSSLSNSPVQNQEAFLSESVLYDSSEFQPAFVHQGTVEQNSNAFPQQNVPTNQWANSDSRHIPQQPFQQSDSVSNIASGFLQEFSASDRHDISEVDRRLHVDSKLVEVFSCPGAEMVARVGTEVILGCDILPEAKKMAHFEIQHRMKELPPDKKAMLTEAEIEQEKTTLVQQVFPMVLEQHVKSTLLYCEFACNRSKEDMQMVEKKIGDSFDNEELSRIMKQFEANSRMELNQKLERYIGSSIEREKALFIRKVIAHVTLSEIIKEAEGDCTHDEMFNYYNKHQAEFFHKAKVKWEQLSVHISPQMPEAESRAKIEWMGGQILNGVPFATVATHHSDGSTAKSGGAWDWTVEGSLVSEVIEKTLFKGPIGIYSPILRDSMGFHIVRVLERQNEYYTPFLESQTKIRAKIKEQRRNKKEAELFTDLSRRFQPETYQNTVLESPKKEVKTIFPQIGGTSLHSRDKATK